MSQRFSYVKYDKVAVAKQERLKAMFSDIEDYVANNLLATREQALILNALEEGYMWAGKAIRDEQIIRTNETVHIPGRG